MAIMKISLIHREVWIFEHFFLDIKNLLIQKQVILWVWVVGFDSKGYTRQNYNVVSTMKKKPTQFESKIKNLFKK